LYLKKALTLKDAAEANLALGYVYLMLMKDPLAALPYLEASAENSPDMYAYYYLGIAYLRLNDFKKGDNFFYLSKYIMEHYGIKYGLFSDNLETYINWTIQLPNQGS
jgi:tetratricopeptide (TPR) repeat protein